MFFFKKTAKTRQIFPLSLLCLMLTTPSCAITRWISGGPDSDYAEPDFERYQEQVKNAYSAGDVALGMQMRDVEKLWGKPSRQEWAGDSSAGNARWTYYQGLASSQAMSQARVVYFEEGQVVGWETKRPN